MPNVKKDKDDLFMRVPAELAVPVREMAQDEERSASQQIRHYIRKGLKEDGFVFPDKQ